MSSSSLEKGGFANWLDRFFEKSLYYPTIDRFQRQIKERLRQEMNASWQQLRKTLRREVLNLDLEVPAVVFGGQSKGLNATSVTLGKRIVASCLVEGILAYDYRAQTDVAGSEAGLNKVILPNPFHPNGIESVPILKDRYFDIPTSNISASLFKKKELFATLDKIYSRRNPRYEGLRKLIENLLDTPNLSIADFNDQLFLNLCEEIGLPPFPNIRDLEFDTLSFIKGGGELIMENWKKIIEMARRVQSQLGNTYGLRVPEENEAPFFIIIPNTQYPRARILWERERGVFWGVHPQNPQKIVIEETSFDDFLEMISNDQIKIAWRAIPRAIILSTTFDGHISGGGALYNHIVAPVFEELTGVPHYPIAFLSPINEQEGEGILQYKSAACRKTGSEGKTPPYADLATEAVRRNIVSLLDFYLSIKPENARLELQEFIDNNRGTLPLDARIRFSNKVYIHS